MVVSRKGELTILPIATKGFSLREDYYKVFDEIIGKPVSGIEYDKGNAYRKIREVLDEYLKK